MSTSAATKTAACVNCGQPYTYTPVFLWGEEVFNNGLCDPCEQERLANARREHEHNERMKRLNTWDHLDLPLKDSNPALYPNPRCHSVVNWKFGPKAPFCHGPSGQGKTRSVVQLCRRLWVDEAREFKFLPWHQWQSELDKAHRYGGSGMAREIQAVQRWPFLVIDDVGKGKPTEHVVSAFFTVIDYRSSRGMPTAITTKYALSASQGSPFEQRLALGSQDAARDVCRRLCETSINSPFN